jgi:hypothetical protein
VVSDIGTHLANSGPLLLFSRTVNLAAFASGGSKEPQLALTFLLPEVNRRLPLAPACASQKS